MKTEELKMLMDALQNLGAAGKEAFIWWLAADKVLPTLVVFFAVAIGAWVIFYAIRRAWDGDKDSKLVSQLCVLLDCKDRRYDEYNRSIVYETVRALKERSTDR